MFIEINKHLDFKIINIKLFTRKRNYVKLYGIRPFI